MTKRIGREEIQVSLKNLRNNHIPVYDAQHRLWNTVPLNSASIQSASYAATASILLGSIVSASYATTSSYSQYAQTLLGTIANATSASYAQTASIANSAGYAVSSSYATTASFISTASYALTSKPFPYTGSAQILGNLGVTTSDSYGIEVLNGTTRTVLGGSVVGYVGTTTNNPLNIIVNTNNAWQFNTATGFQPVFNNSSDIGLPSTRVKTIWTTNISSSNPIDAAIYAATASLLLGSVNSASYAQTASVAISASWAPAAAGVTGGTTNYIPLWSSPTTLSSSVLFQSSSNIGIRTTSPSSALDVNGTTTLRGNLLFGAGGLYDIGTSGSNRPLNVYVSSSILIESSSTGTQLTTLIRNGFISLTYGSKQIANWFPGDYGGIDWEAGRSGIVFSTGNTLLTSNLVFDGSSGVRASGGTSALFYQEPSSGWVWQGDTNFGASGSAVTLSNRMTLDATGILTLFNRLAFGTHNVYDIGTTTVKPRNIYVGGFTSASSFIAPSYTSSINNAIGFFGTASWAQNATSSSFANTASAATSITFTPSTASFANTASNLIGGSTNYIPLWNGPTVQTSSVLFQSASNVGINTTSPSGTLTISGPISGALLVNTLSNRDNTDGYLAVFNIPRASNTLSGGGLMVTTNQALGGGKALLSAVNYQTTDGTNTKPNIFSATVASSSYATRVNTNGALVSSIDINGSNLLITNQNLYIKNNNINNTANDFINSQAYLYVQSSSTTTNVNAYTGYTSRAQLINNTETIGTFTDFSAMTFQNNIFGTVTTRYGLLIDFPATGITNPYGIYQSKTGIINYFNGSIGIGTTTPGAPLHVQGSVSASSFTGSLSGTAATASFVSTASFAATSSAATSITFTPSTASYAQTASVVMGIVSSASYATNADLLDGLDSTVFASTGSNRFNGNQTISGSMIVTGSSVTLTSSMFLTNGRQTNVYAMTVDMGAGAAGALYRTPGIGSIAFPVGGDNYGRGTITNFGGLHWSIQGSIGFATVVPSLFSINGDANAWSAATVKYGLNIPPNDTYQKPVFGVWDGTNSRFTIDYDGALSWYDSLKLTRDGASILAQRSGSAAQTFRIYNTFTDATNFERGKLEWAGNTLIIGTEHSGSGNARDLAFQTSGSTRMFISSSGDIGIGTNNPAVRLQIQGNVSASSYTSSLSNAVGFFGTSSWAQNTTTSTSSSYAQTASVAITASFLLGNAVANNAISSSYAQTASIASTASFLAGNAVANNAISSSYAGTASLALTASFLAGNAIATNAVSASYASTSSVTTFALNGFPFSGSAIITGSLLISSGGIYLSGSGITGSLLGSASFATTASAATSITFTPATASFANTASNLIGGSTNYIPLWNSATAQSSSNIYQDSSGNIAVGSTATNGKLYVAGDIAGEVAVRIGNTSANNAAVSRLYLDTQGNTTSIEGLRNGGALTLTTNNVERLRVTNAGPVLIGTTSTSTNGLLQVSGSIGLLGNTQIRQATNSDGNALQVFATQLVAGRSNSTSYGYSDGALIAGISNFDNSRLLDVGRVDSASGRFVVQNTTGGHITVSVTSGSNTIFQVNSTGVVGIGTTTPGATLHVQGNISASSFTGSLNGPHTGSTFGTASWANNAITASAATSITFTPSSASFATTASAATSITFTPSTASYAATASVLLGSITSASFATTASAANSITFTPSTASYATTASVVTGTVSSASFAQTASFVNVLLQNVSASGNISAGTNLQSNYSVGDEGGEINLSRPQTNSSISGSVVIDVWQNRVRIFEANSPNRGAFIDITTLPNGVTTDLTRAVSASYAATASVLLGSITSASFATTASAAASITFTPSTASFATTASAATSITFTPSTASFANTASAATSITFTPSTASFAITASYVSLTNIDNISALRTGSFTGSFIGTHSGSTFGTASWAQNVISSSFATTASAATSITFIPATASAATSITFTPNTASFATTASAATSITFTPVTASYALSASWAPPVTGSVQTSISWGAVNIYRAQTFGGF